MLFKYFSQTQIWRIIEASTSNIESKLKLPIYVKNPIISKKVSISETTKICFDQPMDWNIVFFEICIENLSENYISCRFLKLFWMIFLKIDEKTLSRKNVRKKSIYSICKIQIKRHVHHLTGFSIYTISEFFFKYATKIWINFALIVLYSVKHKSYIALKKKAKTQFGLNIWRQLFNEALLSHSHCWQYHIFWILGGDL